MNNIKIIINEEVRKKFKFDFEKNIKNLLQVIPPDHLACLEKIVVDYDTSQNVFGFYYGQDRMIRYAYIVIFAKKIIDYCPKYLSTIFPFIFHLILSHTLYHEIGHHYQRLRHGYRKEIWETHADRYSLYMQRKMFLSKGFGRIFYSLRFIILPVINLLKKRIK